MKANDWVRAVEVCYQLDGSDEAWLRQLAETARPFLDVGLGMSAWTYQISGGREHVRDVVMLADEAGVRLATIARISSEADTRPLAHGYASGPVGTLADVVHRFPSFVSYVERLERELGVGDIRRASITDPSGSGVGFGTLLPIRGDAAYPRSPNLARLAVHAQTAHRARQRRAAEAARDDAVVAPSGRVIHAEGDARDVTARESLRRAAVAIDRARGRMRLRDPEGAIESWRALVSGAWSLVDQFESDGRRFLVARRNEPRSRKRGGLTQAECVCAGYAALGHPQKLIAYELGVSPSTVSTHVRGAMRKLSITTRAELRATFGAPGPATSNK